MKDNDKELEEEYESDESEDEKDYQEYLEDIKRMKEYKQKLEDEKKKEFDRLPPTLRKIAYENYERFIKQRNEDYQKRFEEAKEKYKPHAEEDMNRKIQAMIEHHPIAEQIINKILAKDDNNQEL